MICRLSMVMGRGFAMAGSFMVRSARIVIGPRFSAFPAYFLVEFAPVFRCCRFASSPARLRMLIGSSASILHLYFSPN